MAISGSGMGTRLLLSLGGLRPSGGEVKIDTGLKNASVYVDGGYVGPISKFKTFELLPAITTSNFTIRPIRFVFHQLVHVIMGKTTELRSRRKLHGIPPSFKRTNQFLTPHCRPRVTPPGLRA